jgi:hypothetical protein
MLRNRAYVAAVQIEMAQAAVLTITNQQERLIEACIKRKAMAAIQLALATALSRVARFIISILIEAKDARIAITIGDKDGIIRGRHSRRNAPFIGGLEPSLRGSGNFQHDAAVSFKL